MSHIFDDVDLFSAPDPSRTLPPIIWSIGSPLYGERNRCLYQSEKTKSKRMEAMRSRDSAEFISEFGSSVPLVHASVSFIDCSPCPGNITDRLIDIQSWQSALRRLSTCRRRRGNGAATLSRCSTPRTAVPLYVPPYLSSKRNSWIIIRGTIHAIIGCGIGGRGCKGTLKESCILNGYNVDWYAFDYKSIRPYWIYYMCCNKN